MLLNQTFPSLNAQIAPVKQKTLLDIYTENAQANTPAPTEPDQHTPLLSYLISTPSLSGNNQSLWDSLVALQQQGSSNQSQQPIAQATAPYAAPAQEPQPLNKSLEYTASTPQNPSQKKPIDSSSTLNAMLDTFKANAEQQSAPKDKALPITPSCGRSRTSSPNAIIQG
jgi:hypothetical protein